MQEKKEGGQNISIELHLENKSMNIMIERIR